MNTACKVHDELLDAGHGGYVGQPLEGATNGELHSCKFPRAGLFPKDGQIAESSLTESAPSWGKWNWYNCNRALTRIDSYTHWLRPGIKQGYQAGAIGFGRFGHAFQRLLDTKKPLASWMLAVRHWKGGFIAMWIQSPRVLVLPLVWSWTAAEWDSTARASRKFVALLTFSMNMI